MFQVSGSKLYPSIFIQPTSINTFCYSASQPVGTTDYLTKQTITKHSSGSLCKDTTLPRDLPLHFQTQGSVESTDTQRKRPKRKPVSEHPLCGLMGAERSPEACHEGLLRFNAGIHSLSFSSMSSVLLHQLSGLKDPGGWPANSPVFFLK